MEALFEYFNRIQPIDQRQVDEMRPLLKSRTLSKNEFLLRPNEVCRFMAFALSGSFRSFQIRSSGEQMNIMLTPAHEFVSDMQSLISEQASNLSIQAIEKSELLFITKEDLSSLYEVSLYWNQLGRKMTERTFVLAKLRAEELLYKSPEERYRGLLNHSPHLLRQYSLTDIASYIGVTPQSLSRIRKRI